MCYRVLRWSYLQYVKIIDITSFEKKDEWHMQILKPNSPFISRTI